MNQDNPWKKLIIESLVIVTSILLAFAIDAWWDGRQELREERIILEQLHDEFIQNQQSLRISEDTHRQQRDSIANMLRLIAQRGDPPGSYDLPEIFFAAGRNGGLGYHTWEPSRGVIDSLIASGRIGLIRDDSLRIELSAWIEEIAQQRIDEDTDGEMRLSVREIINRFVPMVNLSYNQQLESISSPSPFEADYQGLLNSIELENVLLERVRKKNQIIEGDEDGIGELLKRSDLIIGLIEAQLAD